MVVPRERSAEAVDASAARTAKEEATRAAFAEGQIGLDRYGLRETLVRLGVRYQSYEEYRRERQERPERRDPWDGAGT